MSTVDEKYTRCPGCLTVFRVTPAQLALRDGQVRCGHCRTVFNGYAQMISLAPMPRESTEAERDDLALGPPTVTLRSARALDPVPDSSRTIPEPSFRTDAPEVARTPKGTIRTFAAARMDSRRSGFGRDIDRAGALPFSRCACGTLAGFQTGAHALLPGNRMRGSAAARCRWPRHRCVRFAG